MSRSLTLSISAMIGMRKRASRSRSEIRPLTSATSCVLGLPCSVNMVSTRRASDSAPGGHVRMSVRSFPLFDPSDLIKAVIRLCIASCTVTSIWLYDAKILGRGSSAQTMNPAAFCSLVQELRNLYRQGKEKFDMLENMRLFRRKLYFVD